MTLRQPKGLGYQGGKLWHAIVEEYDLSREPAKQRILFDAAKLADAIDLMDKEAAKSPLIVPGSYKQPVLHPAVSGAQTARSLLAGLLARLNFEPLPEEY